MLVYYKKTHKFHSLAKKIDDENYVIYTDDTLTDVYRVRASQLVFEK